MKCAASEMMAKLPAITPPIKGQIIQQVNFNFIYLLNKNPIDGQFVCFNAGIQTTYKET
jgi:hypothetical protein